MQRLVTFVLALGSLLAIGGCGGEDSTPSGEDPGDGTLVTYTRSGGFEVIYEQLTIRTDGSAVLASGFPGPHQKTRRFTLPADELASLEDAIAAADLEKAESTMICSDCYEYSIETAEDEVSFADVDIADDRDGPQVSDDVIGLVGELSAIARAHAGPGPSIGG